MSNSTFPKVAVQYFNQALFFYLCLCQIDTKSLRNSYFRLAEKTFAVMLKNSDEHEILV
jgi:hypothetical protein